MPLCLKNKQVAYKEVLRKLVRSHNAADSMERDRQLFDSLLNQPSKVYKVIKANKASTTRKISKLTVTDRVFSDASKALHLY